MKKFINEHPRLYWMIVILIAGLAFGIVTGIGCAKLEKAEAASVDGVAYLDLWHEVNWGDYAGQKETIRNAYKHMVVVRQTRYGAGGNYGEVDAYRYLLSNECGYASVWDNTYVLSQCSALSIYVENGVVKEAPIAINNPPIAVRLLDSWEYYKPICSTYDFRGEHTSSFDYKHIEYYVAPEPKYLVNAPFLEYQSVETQSNYVNDKIHPIDEGYHTINYKIAGQPMTPPDGYEVLYEYRVYLPTKDYFYQYLRDDLLIDLDGLNTMQANISKWRRNSVGSSDSKLWIFNLDRNIEAEKTSGDDVRIRLDYADIQTEIEEFNSVSLKEYYGFDDDAWGAYGKYIMAHLVVYRVDCIVYTYNTPDIYYGRNITVHFPPYLDKPIVTEYNGDYFNPDYDYDKEVDAKIDQALKDAKEESDALLEEYKGMISNQENMFGSFDSEFADVGLWGALRGIGSGFLGLTGFITNFAVLIGGIFSFVPIAFQQYVGYTLLAILLIGLWKTIKG